jgi:aryl-alcohol dehydrogenase-like predicted oxidoreductase
MNLSHTYGAPPPRHDEVRLIRRALDLGVTHFDTAALYGFGRNEELVGKALGVDREGVLLARKCGMTGVDGKRVIDGRPETLTRTCEESLTRLGTDHVDLYYLHRWDKSVPIEDSVGALASLVRAGKIGAIGLSEVSAATLRRAHATFPIAAVQSEYSLFTRNPERGALAACGVRRKQGALGATHNSSRNRVANGGADDIRDGGGAAHRQSPFHQSPSVSPRPPPRRQGQKPKNSARSRRKKL